MMYPKQTKQRPAVAAASRKSLYLAVAASLLGVSTGSSSSSSWGSTRKQPLAFASPKVVDDSSNSKATAHKRERESNVRLFSRGPDTLLSAATLTLTGESRAAFTTTPSSSTSEVTDPFDPNFRPPSSFGDDPYWGVPLPVVTEDRTTSTTATADLSLDDFHIYCDLDGVLVDFEKGVQSICQAPTHELSKTTMWHKIAQSQTNFFQELSWTHDGPQLWQAIAPLKPTILTGVPDLEASRREKFDWCRQNLQIQGRHVDMAGYGYRHDNVNGQTKACPIAESHVTNVITCWSYNKHHESGVGAILIDDRIALKESWEAAGGIFVHHTSTDKTLKQLKALGVLKEDDDDAKEEDRLLP